MKKIFAIALALVMVLSMASAFAAYCDTTWDWSCATNVINCGKATIEVIPYVRSTTACAGESEFVQSSCAAAVPGAHKRKLRFCEVFSSSACACGAGSSGRRVRKPSVFIRSDVHAVRAGMNIRGQGFERARWAMKRKALPVRQGGREANATLTDYAELRVCSLYPNRN